MECCGPFATTLNQGRWNKPWEKEKKKKKTYLDFNLNRPFDDDVRLNAYKPPINVIFCPRQNLRALIKSRLTVGPKIIPTVHLRKYHQRTL